MTSQLPLVPRILFTVVEPISFVAGFIGTVVDTPWFVEQQIPQKIAAPVTENSIVLAWQLGNMYLVLSFVAVALFTSTSEVKVIRRYITALALGDIGHILSTSYALGIDRLTKPAELNSMAYANIVMTIFLFGMRMAYFGGVFGPDGGAPAVSKKRA